MNPQYPAVAQRARHRCEYCHAPEAIFNFPFEVEHVVPTALGGSDDLSALALACRSCNLFKSDAIEATDPETEQLCRLFDPRQDLWEEHLRVNQESAEVEGLTPIGRATATRLQMNRPAQLAARLLWLRLGLFE